MHHNNCYTFVMVLLWPGVITPTQGKPIWSKTTQGHRPFDMILQGTHQDIQCHLPPCLLPLRLGETEIEGTFYPSSHFDTTTKAPETIIEEQLYEVYEYEDYNYFYEDKTVKQIREGNYIDMLLDHKELFLRGRELNVTHSSSIPISDTYMDITRRTFNTMLSIAINPKSRPIKIALALLMAMTLFAVLTLITLIFGTLIYFMEKV